MSSHAISVLFPDPLRAQLGSVKLDGRHLPWVLAVKVEADFREGGLVKGTMTVAVKGEQIEAQGDVIVVNLGNGKRYRLMEEVP